MKALMLIPLLSVAACAARPVSEPLPIPAKLTTGPWSVVPETIETLQISDAPGYTVWTFKNRMGQSCIVTYGDQPVTASCGVPEQAKTEVPKP